MKLPKFNHANQRWDSWGEFHVNLEGSAFTQFSTGELICTSLFHTRSGWGNSSKEGRGRHPSLGLESFQVNDQPEFLSNKVLYDPNTNRKVLKSWLPQACPMMYDMSAGRVVMLRSLDKDGDVPDRFRNRHVTMYWAGDGRMPVAGGPIYYSEQNTISKEYRAIATARRMLVKAQVRVGAIEDQEQAKHYYASGGDKRVNYMDVVNTEVSAMSDEFKWQLAKYGFAAGTTRMETDYLEVRDV